MPANISGRKIYAYCLLTLGLYFFYWCSRSREAVNRAAGQELVPSTWLLIVPAANYWWAWQYARALEYVSYKRIKYADTFLLYVIATLGPFMVLGTLFGWVDGDTAEKASTHTLIVGGLIALGILIILFALGLGFFCATMQKKIEAARAHLPSNPVR